MPTFKHKNNKEVAQILDDSFIIVYDSITDATKATGISDISAVCKGSKNRRTAGGYKWKYYNEITS